MTDAIFLLKLSQIPKYLKDKSYNTNMSIKNPLTSPYLWSFLMIMLGLWMLCWGGWGGSIQTTTTTSNSAEAGLGLNPPF